MAFIRVPGFATPETWLDRLLRVLPFLLLAVPFLPYVLAQAPTAGDIGPNDGSGITWLHK